MSAIDTPDWQYGIVNAQKLLATVAGGTGLVVVGIPTNAESLIVVAAQGVAPPDSCAVIGLTTGLTYAGARVAGLGGSNVQTYLFDISSCLDAQVEVVLSPIPAGTWYVYSDSGVHVVADNSKLVNRYGVQYVIASAPGTDSNDHPPVEMQVITWYGLANNGQILPAPGGGNRYRVFGITASIDAAGATGIQTPGGQVLALVESAGPVTPWVIDYRPTGIALGNNQGVSHSGTGPTSSGNMVYTTETV